MIDLVNSIRYGITFHEIEIENKRSDLKYNESTECYNLSKNLFVISHDFAILPIFYWLYIWTSAFCNKIEVDLRHIRKR